LGNALRSDLEKESTLSIYGLKKNATNAWLEVILALGLLTDAPGAEKADPTLYALYASCADSSHRSRKWEPVVARHRPCG
jgi:hypothetical protein